MIELSRNVANHTRCYACGRKRNRTKLGYDVRDLRCYCINYNDCMHPNHPNIMLVPQVKSDIEDAINDYHEGEALDAIGKFIGKTASFRPTVSQSYYLALLAQERGILSINQVLQFIVDEYIQEHPDLYRKELYHNMIEESRNAYSKEYNKKALPTKPEKPKEEPPEEKEVFRI